MDEVTRVITLISEDGSDNRTIGFTSKDEFKDWNLQQYSEVFGVKFVDWVVGDVID